MRPIKTDVLPSRPTEQLGDRDTQSLGLDIDQGELDSRDRLGCDAAWTLSRSTEHIPETHFVGTRVLPDHVRLEVVNRATHAFGAAAITALSPARDPIVGTDFDEDPGTPAGADDKCFDVGDFHVVPFLAGHPERSEGSLPVLGRQSPEAIVQIWKEPFTFGLG